MLFSSDLSVCLGRIWLPTRGNLKSPPLFFLVSFLSLFASFLFFLFFVVAFFSFFLGHLLEALGICHLVAHRGLYRQMCMGECTSYEKLQCSQVASSMPPKVYTNRLGNYKLICLPKYDKLLSTCQLIEINCPYLIRTMPARAFLPGHPFLSICDFPLEKPRGRPFRLQDKGWRKFSSEVLYCLVFRKKPYNFHLWC